METYFFINHPAPGKWTIASNPGSVPVTGVDQAAGLPSPDLHAKLSSAGRGRERLRYSLRKIPGQQVSFVDARKGHGFRVLGQAHGSHGAITFSPSSDLGRAARNHRLGDPGRPSPRRRHARPLHGAPAAGRSRRRED